MRVRMHADELPIDEALVRRLLVEQMPEFAHRPLAIVEPWGTDNAVWRLGEDLVIRLPRIHRAAGQIEFEAMWLPRLAPYVPVAVPEPVAVGVPAVGYPCRWAVHRWVPGEGAAFDRLDDPVRFASDVADVILRLQTAPTDGAPSASNRARPLQEYDEPTRGAIERASHLIRVRCPDALKALCRSQPTFVGPSSH